MLKKLKGVIIVAIISLASVMMPFNIYADTQIVPTYSSSAQSWVSNNGYVNVTNYCEGTTAATNSCKLTFTVPSNWYGTIYFDGYDSSNHLWIDYGTVFIADGIGEFNYNFWQSSQKVISKVTIQIINLVQPDSSVDLTQIIDLLTAIENDTSSIDLTLDNTLSQITNVLNQLIISNGYLDTLTKLRQWNPYFESYAFITYLLRNNFNTYTNSKFNYLNYPIFVLNQNDIIYKFNSSGNPSSKYYSTTFIMYLSSNIYDITTLSSVLSVDHGEFSNFEQISYNFDGSLGWSLIKFNVTNFDGSYTVNLKYINSAQRFLIPIYTNVSNYSNISTEFALLFKLNNSYLDNINKIANGTTQSNQANNDLNTASSEFTSQSDDVIGVEENITNNFESQVQNIDINTGLSGFGSNFMTSATWVRTQFDRLTENNPYGSLVAYGLTLGFALLMLGKVLL